MIPLHYCADIHNFGDELSPYIVNKITGQNVNLATSGKRLYAVGSLLTYEAMRSHCVVWGSGTLHHDDLNRMVRLFPVSRSIPKMIKRLKENKKIVADVRAVRGPLTRKVIIKTGGMCPEVYGDPAIVMPRLYKPVVCKKYKAGLILHYTQNTTCVSGIAERCGIRLISINRVGSEQLESFIDEVCSCEKIFSTSLHGIIIAQAYGIPAQWVRLKWKAIHRDSKHKFFDYFLGATVPVQLPISIDLNSAGLSQLAGFSPDVVHIPDLTIDRLLDAFPFDVFPRVEHQGNLDAPAW